MKSLFVKNATLQEVPEILALDKICFGGIWSEAGYKREIDSPNSFILLLFLNRDNNKTTQLIGLGCLWSIVEEAHITLLGIHPDYHRQGLGQLLLTFLLENAVARKLERATLEVKITNFAAIALYQKFGFKIAGRRKNYYPKTKEDAFILWRTGLEKPEFLVELDTWKTHIDNLLIPEYTLSSGILNQR